MKDEIESGIKNALERGDSLEQAVKTFVAAGYNPVEVKEAAGAVSLGVSSIVSNKTEIQAKSPMSKSSGVSFQQQSTQSSTQPVQKSQIIGELQPKPIRARRRKIIIIISIILAIILIAMLGTIFLGPSLLELLK